MFIFYYPLITAVFSVFAAQMFKLAVCAAKTRTLDWSVCFSSGGMPSSHAAFVVALSTALALQDGVRSHAFFISLVFSTIVLYDSMGLRRAVGEQAELLNKMSQRYFEKDMPGSLKIIRGHTPVEVIAGFCLGVSLAVLSYMF